jgi:CRP-like cAMP-binding protein
VKRAAKHAFDPKVLLSKVGKGRTLTEYKENQTIFSQNDPADFIFYIQAGQVKLTVISEQGKEAVAANYGAGKAWRGSFAPRRSRLF